MDSMDEARITPEQSVAYSLSRDNLVLEDLGVCSTVVVSWGLGAVRAFAEDIGASLAENWLYGERNPLYVGQVAGHSISIAHLPVGSPGTVMLMEEMIVCGARRFIGLGWAGSLQPYAPVGTLLIPTSCLREEGTSLHYVEDPASLVPDPTLVRALHTAATAEGHGVLEGPLWTTDAPYRELVSKVQAYGDQGVLGVDMETSAMYALGRYREVAVANLLVVSDELWHEWRPAFGTAALVAATRAAWQVVKRVISDLGSPSDTLAEVES
jgi:uridine phosphorylase